jgi:hypothetical protein
VASEDAQFVEQMLAEATTHDAMEPEEAAELVIAAIREGTYLVPTRPSYAAQLRERCEALVERRLPAMPTFD